MSAPIVVFAYRRPAHLRRCLEALALNPEAAESELTIYVDGPKGEADREAVEQTRQEARQAQGFARIHLVFRERNQGLSRSIIEGVGEQLARSGELIVVEDDLVVSPVFLRYLNDGLRVYRDRHDVVSIHAYVYPVGEPLPDTFLLRGADCWGWATWARGWRCFNPDGAALLRELDARGLAREFDFGGRAGYRRMLQAQVAGRNDSWAVRWYASAFLAGRFTLYPGCSLVENIGRDGSGTHSAAESAPHFAIPGSTPVRVEELPASEDASARRAFEAHFRRSTAGPVRRLLRRLRGLGRPGLR